MKQRTFAFEHPERALQYITYLLSRRYAFSALTPVATNSFNKTTLSAADTLNCIIQVPSDVGNPISRLPPR